MGSSFSSPAAAAAAAGPGELDYSRSSFPPEYMARPMPKEMLAKLEYDPAGFQQFVDRASVVRPKLKQQEIDARFISRLVHRALQHYNSNNPGAEFQCTVQSTTEMKAACVGFREHLWYHVGFSAHRKPDDNAAPVEIQHFFAELRFERCSCQLTVETCTILEKPLCAFRSRCAFCPDESKILHPSDAEFVCGKEEHEKEFSHITLQQLYRNN